LKALEKGEANVNNQMPQKSAVAFAAIKNIEP
jgi:hypothetical protein